MSILDLRILENFIKEKGLGLCVGAPTPPDGSCFLHSCRQTMVHLKNLGRWAGDIPEVEELRAKVIEFMKQNQHLWTRPQFNEDLGIFQDAPYEEDDFRQLIKDQSRPRAWTDRDGVFVQATTKYLNKSQSEGK